VRRRICLGAALGACILASLAGSAFAASGKSNSKSSSSSTKVHCATNTSIAVANGVTDVEPPVAQGSEYGTASCNKGLGAGVQKDTFNVPASGDTIAKYTLYFKAGSIHGTYDLTPQSSELNFLATSWMGTLKVLGGTGALKGVTGTGTMMCNSADGIHTSCTDKLKLKGFTAG
jgi:hypothetical protein